MAVQTPHINLQGLPTDDFCVLQMSLQMELLHPAKLSLTLRGKTSPLSLTDASKMMGANIDLSVQTQRRDARQELLENETLVFHGIVFGVQNGRSVMGSTPVITLTAYSPDHLLIDHPHCTSFEESDLATIVNQSIGDYSGAHSFSIDPFNTDPIAYTVQYNENTYQFLSRLAMRYGEYMYHDGKTFVFGRIPNPQKKKLYPDIDILSYRYSLEMTHDLRTLAAHDYMSYENPTASLSGKDSPYRKNTLHDFSSASPIGVTSKDLETAANVERKSFQSRQKLCHLRTQCAGLRMGDKIIIEEHDGDKNLTEHSALTIIAISHSLNADGHYENEITAILCGDDSRPPYPEGDYYPRCSTQRAVVTDNNDPDQLGRIRVQFLWQKKQDEKTPWLRISQPHGGKNKGFYFIPENDEEVMVAFENGNAEKPYVVGTLYHAKANPDGNHYSESNNVKAIRTRNGHTIEIHDEGSGENGGGYIQIYDNNKNNYVLTFSTDEQLIKLESKKNIELQADNDIIIHAKHDIVATADNDMTITVKNNRTMNVEKDDTNTIKNNQTTEVNKDQTTIVGNNQKIEVSEDQIVDITGECGVKVGKGVSVEADSIKIEADNDLRTTSKTHKQKADRSMIIDGGSEANIKANVININS